MNFEFSTASRIIFGIGKSSMVGTIASSFGNRALVLLGYHDGHEHYLLNQLSDANIEVNQISVKQEPTINSVQECVQFARKMQCDLVVSIGGGSAIDTGKAVAALLANPGQILDYLEVIGHGKKISNPSIPFIALPTTAGTGSEVTQNAVFSSEENNIKISLRSPLMFPKIALIDPELTYNLPSHLTASTGLDALTQVIEPFLSLKANPMTDALCREGIKRAGKSLLAAYYDDKVKDARTDMCLVSLFSGLALANSKLGAVHGFAAPIGGMVSAPHGAICARLLPLVLDVNLKALKQRDENNPVIERFDEMAQLLTGKPNAIAEDGIQWLHVASASMSIPTLSKYGLTRDQFPGLIDAAGQASSMQGNPIQLTKEEMQSILEAAY